MTIIMAGDFRLTELDGVRPLDVASQPWEELAAVLSLRHDKIGWARVEQTGEIAVAFTSERRLDAGPSNSYENWEVSGPGFQLIATPGGGVAFWSHPD